jgi:hypothetical protein
MNHPMLMIELPWENEPKFGIFVILCDEPKLEKTVV